MRVIGWIIVVGLFGFSTLCFWISYRQHQVLISPQAKELRNLSVAVSRIAPIQASDALVTTTETAIRA